jgi:VWFA-related protein
MTISRVLVSGTVCLAGVVSGPVKASAQAPAQPTFRASVNLVTTDVVVRNRLGQFQADLTKDDFELYEDGVRQELTSFVLVHGGRAYTTQVAAPTATREGIILPASRPANDTAGRIIIFVIDDLHLEARNTPRVRQLFQDMARELVHEGDLFGIVSTGTSSIAIDLTYDRTRMQEAASRITGGGLTPSEIIEQSAAGQTPQEVSHRVNVAFETVYQLLNNLEQAQHRRKAVVLISGGYDLDPFASSRGANDPANALLNQGAQFADADLTMRLSELIRQANRANVTFYTVDPRGLVAGQDIDQPISSTEWDSHLRKSQDSLRVLAEQTGGVAVVNTNDFSRALKRIDAETSDYYVLGYYSSNPDPTQRRRQVEIRVSDQDGRDLDVTYRREYTLKPIAEASKPK